MAINFLNNVNFNSIQVQDIVIENFTTAAAGAGVLGQMYFDTTLDTMMQFVANDGTGNAGYIEIGTTSGVESLAVGNATVNTGDVNTGLVLSAATGVITITPKIYGGTDKVGMVPTGGTANKYLDGTGAWIDVTTGDIESVTQSAILNRLGIAITSPTGPDPVVGLNIEGQTALAATPAANDELIIYDLSTVTNKKITVENLVGGYETTYTLPVTAIAGNNAQISLTPNTGAVDSTVNFIGTTGRIALTSNAANNGDITINFPDDVVIVDDLLVGGVIKTTGSSTTTGVNSSALSASTALALTANNTGISIGMTVEGTGIPSGVTIAVVTNASNFTLSSAITIASGITLTFTEINSFASALDMNNNKLVEVKTGTSGTDGVNLAQVQDLVAGIGLFKGGYNATTGLTTDITPNGSLDGASNIALDSGDFFVVTTGGSAFYTTVLEVGDMIFANQAIAVDSTPDITEYTVVIQDANIATAGATDILTRKGVAGFDSANFTVTASGWVQIKALSRLNGRKQTLNDGANATPVSSPVARTFLNNLTTFVINLADDSLFGTGALAEDVTAEVMQNASPFQTVYADVTRSGSASMSIIFSGNVAVDAYRVLLEYV